MRILILAAFENELETIAKHFDELKEIIISKCRCTRAQYNHHDIILSLTGIGTSAATITTTLLCEALKPDLILFCGVAGGLKAEQQIGDLILANKIIDIDLHQLPRLIQDTPYAKALKDPHLLTTIDFEYTPLPSITTTISQLKIDHLKLGTIVTSNIFPAPLSVFDDIKKLDCSAIEMESAGLFKAANYFDVPVIVLRAISNLLNEDGEDLGTESDALSLCAKRLATALFSILGNIEAFNLPLYSNSKEEIEFIVQKYQLEQHPEGGFYRQTFLSKDEVKAENPALARYKGETRKAGSSIIYLLKENDFSAWHSVQSDETWYFHAGDPLLLRVINPETQELSEIRLGFKDDYLQFTVKAGHIFSAESLGRYSLMGCAVTPGFDFKDFKLYTQEEFLKICPKHTNFLRLIRNEPKVQIPEIVE